MRRKNGDVVVSRHRQEVVVLRGQRAVQFVDAVAQGSDQEVMARVTGNYKRGNDRRARRHPRNSG